MPDYTAYAYELLSVASATIATSFTSTVYDLTGLPAREAVVTVNPGVPIRYTIDGTTVTTGTGHARTAYNEFKVEGHENIKNFRTTSTKSGTAGSISVTYYR